MESIISNLISYISQQMPDICRVDEDYGQLAALDEEGKQMYTLAYPAVLIELTDIEWDFLQGQNQKGEAKVRVRLVLDCYDDTHSGSGSELLAYNRDQMRRRLDVLLMGYRPLGDGGMMRTTTRFFTSNHGIKVYETHYTMTVTELVK